MPSIAPMKRSINPSCSSWSEVDWPALSRKTGAFRLNTRPHQRRAAFALSAWPGKHFDTGVHGFERLKDGQALITIAVELRGDLLEAGV